MASVVIGLRSIMVPMALVAIGSRKIVVPTALVAIGSRKIMVAMALVEIGSRKNCGSNGDGRDWFEKNNGSNSFGRDWLEKSCCSNDFLACRCGLACFFRNFQMPVFVPGVVFWPLHGRLVAGVVSATLSSAGGPFPKLDKCCFDPLLRSFDFQKLGTSQTVKSITT